MRRYVYGFTAFLASLFVVFGLTTAASATSPPSCNGVDMTTASGQCADISSSSSSAHVTSASYAALNTKGKVLLRWQMASGIKRHAVKGCPFVPQGHAWRGSCVRLHHGAHFINSGVRTNGSLYWFRDVVTSKWMMFVHRSDGWHKAGDNRGNGNCGNRSKPTGHVTPTVKQVILVRSFTNWKFHGHVGVGAGAQAASTAKAWCNTATSHAVASGNGSSKSSASTSASITLRGLTKIQAWLKGTSARLKQSFRLQLLVSVQASAKAQAASRASAHATCSSTPPPPSCNNGRTFPYCNAPGLTLSATGCAGNGNSSVLSGTVTNNNDAADTGDLTLSPTGQTRAVALAANGSSPYSFTVSSAGTYTVSVTLEKAGLSASQSVTVQECQSPPPPPHTTTVNCTTPEEITVGGSSLMPCSVLDDNGAVTTLTAKSLDGNSMVTQVYCAADGSSSCAPGSNDWRVRIQGLNAGTTTIRVTATANGVKDVEDFPIRVDPSNP